MGLAQARPNYVCFDMNIVFFLSGLRYLEAFFGLLIAVMCGMFGWMVSTCRWSCVHCTCTCVLSNLCVCFFLQYVYAAPNQLDVLKGVAIPYCDGCDSTAVLQGLGLVGAVIMPHNIYLHSGLVLVILHV